MRYVTYEQFRGSLLDALNLQGLLSKLSDFLLQSGFAGGQGWNPWDEYGDERDTLDALATWVSGDPDQRRGELVIVASGRPAPPEPDAERIDAALALLADDLSTRRAAQVVAQLLGVPRKRVYRRALELAREE